MRCVARDDRIAFLTFRPEYVQRSWLRDYLPRIGPDDADRFPLIEDLTAWLPNSSVAVVEIPADCTNLFLGALFGEEPSLDVGVRLVVAKVSG